MKLPLVVTPLYIYHACYTWERFWEEKFTQVNKEIFGNCNVRKHMKINNGEQYIVLDISLKFGDPDKIKIISS